MANQQGARMAKDLQRALLTLLARFPFETITVRQIAEEAMVNRTTIYAHYEDKYALLKAMLETQFGTTRIISADLTTKPFATLALLCQGSLAPVVTRQRDDMAFQRGMMQLFFHELELTGTANTLTKYVLIGRIKAVMHWVRETNQPYNLYTAGAVLDELFVQANKQLEAGLLRRS